MNEVYSLPENDYRGYLQHHGILGMKWGVRRYQNSDGSLTNAGKKRYAKSLANEKGTPNSAVSTYEMSKAHRKDFSKNMSIDEMIKLAELNDKADNLSYEHDTLMEKKVWSNDKIWNQAYQDTYKWLEKNDPEYLKEIVKENGGSKKNLDDFHGFRKHFEGFHDIATSEATEKFESDPKNAKLLNALDSAVESRDRYVQELSERMIGKYGNMKLKGGYGNVSDVARYALTGIGSKELEEFKQEKIKRAIDNDSFDVNFGETLQNDAVMHIYRPSIPGKGSEKAWKEYQADRKDALIKEYRKYLDNPRDYLQNFKESDYQKQYKNSPKVREAMRIAKADGWNALTEAQKELLLDIG